MTRWGRSRGEGLKTIRPFLAPRWTASPDGLPYTFTLRPNVRSASGNPLTAADFKWSFERLASLGGRARAEKLPAEERKRIALLSVEARRKKRENSAVPKSARKGKSV